MREGKRTSQVALASTAGPGVYLDLKNSKYVDATRISPKTILSFFPLRRS